MSAYGIDLVLSRLEGVKRSATGWMARCPAHDDRSPSLHIWEDDEGRVAYHCFAGCDHARVRDALGLADEGRDDDYPSTYKPRGSTVALPIIAKYRYTDEQGRWLYTVGRTPKGPSGTKHFPTWRPDPADPSRVLWGLAKTRRVLYRLPELLEAVRAGVPVYEVEGEKDVHAVEKAGGIATCNPHGAGKWRDEYSECLRGAQVVIIADKDEPGRKHAFAVAASLAGRAADIRIVEAAEGKDAADHLAAGKTLDELVPCRPDDGPPSELPVISLSQLLSETPERPEYVWFGYLAKGAVTELAAKPKVGKTHLSLQVAASVTRGEAMLDHATFTCPVLYLTEQGRASYAAQAKKLKLHTDWHVLLRASVRNLGWDQVGELVRVYVTQNGIGLVIVDTLSDWAGMRGDDENSAGAALAAMVPLRRIAETGCAVLAVRHERKGTAEIGEASRGSSAFGGGMDILLSLRRTRGRGHENRRELLGVGRFDDTPAAVTVEMNGDNCYHLIALGENVRAREAEEAILAVLPMDEARALSEMEIRKSTELSHSSVCRAMHNLIVRSVVGCSKRQREDGFGQISIYWHEAAK